MILSPNLTDRPLAISPQQVETWHETACCKHDVPGFGDLSCCCCDADDPCELALEAVREWVKEQAECRYCRGALTDPQEVEWRMCAGCYADGIAEQESNR